MNRMNTCLPDNVSKAIADALALKSTGQAGLAVQRLLPLIEEYPELTIVHACLAFMLSCSGAHEEAIERGRKAVQMGPTGEKTSLVLFHVLYTAGRRTEAVEEMKRFLAIRPSKEYAKIAKDLERISNGQWDGELGLGSLV
jgi:predicted Zn-dependent protease